MTIPPKELINISFKSAAWVRMIRAMKSYKGLYSTGGISARLNGGIVRKPK